MTKRSNRSRPHAARSSVAPETRSAPAAPGPDPHAAQAVWMAAGRWPALVLAIVCLACLVPFLNKAYHIDDPLFVWCAQHIREHPFDPYGFPVSWTFDVVKPMSDETKNPPVACYYLALAAWVTRGWREVPLHAAFLVWPLGVAWGTYRLAQRFCTRPLLAALTAVLTPVLLVSATSVMCDVMMLCLWLWALIWWDRGLRRGSWMALVLASFLVGVCALTKYFGANLMLLLVVYTLAMQMEQGAGRHLRQVLGDWPGFWSRLFPLLIAVAILVAYQYVTWRLYGRGLLSDAASYATSLRERFIGRFPFQIKLIMGLVFTGGCVACTLFNLPFLLPWRQPWRSLLAVVALAGISVVSAVVLVPPAVKSLAVHMPGLETQFTTEAAFFAAAGLVLVALALHDLWLERDAGSWLLLLWVAGTMVFAAFVNWAVNGRSILPLVPAAAILIMRRLDQLRGPATGRPEWRLVLPLVPSGVLALAVAAADVSQANTARMAAEQIGRDFRARRGTLWFEGHWGFQYYMQLHGGRSILFHRDPWTNVLGWMWPRPQPGDHLVEPSNNSDVFTRAFENTPYRLTPGCIELRHEPYEYRPCQLLSTTQPALRAGFYSHTFGGELPYAFGQYDLTEHVPSEIYRVYTFLPIRPECLPPRP